MVKEIREDLINKLIPLIKKYKKFKKGDVIFNQNCMRDDTYILLKGKIKISYLLPNGIEVALGYYTDKNIMLTGTREGDPFISLFKIEAIDECLIGIVPSKSIYNNEQLSETLVRYCDIIFKKIYLQMIDLLARNKLESLFSILIRLSNTYGIKVSNGIKINLKLTNTDLAEYIGTSKETISRMFSNMKNLNLIEFDKNRYIILKDVEYMKKKLGCRHCIEQLCIV